MPAAPGPSRAAGRTPPRRFVWDILKSDCETKSPANVAEHEPLPLRRVAERLPAPPAPPVARLGAEITR